MLSMSRGSFWERKNSSWHNNSDDDDDDDGNSWEVLNGVIKAVE